MSKFKEFWTEKENNIKRWELIAVGGGGILIGLAFTVHPGLGLGLVGAAVVFGALKVGHVL